MPKGYSTCAHDVQLFIGAKNGHYACMHAHAMLQHVIYLDVACAYCTYDCSCCSAACQHMTTILGHKCVFVYAKDCPYTPHSPSNSCILNYCAFMQHAWQAATNAFNRQVNYSQLARKKKKEVSIRNHWQIPFKVQIRTRAAGECAR